MTSGTAVRQRCRSSALAFAVLIPITFEVSCVSEDAVGKFAGSSVASLQKGDLVLGDMNGSCERAVRAGQPIDQYVLDADRTRSVKICSDEIHTKNVLAISKVLTAYFSALGELAGSGASSKPAAQEASKHAAAIQMKPPSMEAHMKAAPAEAKPAGRDFGQHMRRSPDQRLRVYPQCEQRYCGRIRAVSERRRERRPIISECRVLWHHDPDPDCRAVRTLRPRRGHG